MPTEAAKLQVDEQKVLQILKSLELPPEVEKVDTRFGIDSTGDPAAWLTFHVKADVKVGPSELTRLEQFLSEVTTALLQADIAGFPYTLLEQAA